MDSTKLLIYGDQIDFHLLKLAIDCATRGSLVWFIAPEAINYLPKELQYPDQAILKLIRFFYLKDYFELIKHLNELQSWMQVPSTLIIHKFTNYIKHDYLIAGFLMCNLIDCINYCVKQIETKCYLVLGCYNVSDKNICQPIVDLYLDDLITTDDYYGIDFYK